MKFIGQFIQDFIARFRNDVYLESTETGTIASGGNLGLDSNNKIVKNTISSTTDLASDVTGVLPVSNGGTGNSTLANTGVLTGNGTGAIVSNSTMSYSGEILTIGSTGSAKPQIALVNDNTDAEAPSILFQKTETGADNDDIGLIEFRAENDAGQSNKFATIVGEIETAADGSEGGNLIFNVASHDGELNQGIKISDGTTEDQLDVEIANGVGSTTRVAGSLFLGASDGTPHTFGLDAHDDGDGGALTIRAGSATAGTSNADGGNLNFNAGLSTGGQFGGDFVFNTSYRGSAGSSLNSNFDILKISPSVAGSPLCGFQLFGQNSTDDYFVAAVGNNGAATIATVDADAALADLSINVDGDLTEACVNYSLDASGVAVFDVAGTNITFTQNGSARYRFMVDSTPELDITGNFTLDCSGDVEINADGGTIDFKDGTAQLAKIDTNGLSFVDNTAAAIVFEGDTDDDHQMTFKPGEPTADRIITLPDETGTVALNNISYHHITASFFDTLGTTAHYIPLGDSTAELTSDLNTVTDWIAPCETTVDSIIMRMTNITATANITFTVQKDAVGSSVTSDVESETLSVTSTSEHDVLYFSFDSATIAKGETLKIKIQCASNMTFNTNHFVRVNLIMNWNDRYTGSSQIFTS